MAKKVVKMIKLQIAAGKAPLWVRPASISCSSAKNLMKRPPPRPG